MIEKLKKFFLYYGDIFRLFKDSLYSLVTRPFYFTRFAEQINYIGIGSISITILIGFVMGSVMSLNFGYGLAKFGGTLYVPNVVALSIVREMAPIFTSLLIAGRIGSGMAAEIGSMNVSQQIDALRALGTSPVRILVVPRLLASVICLPLLTALADLFGLIGAWLIAVFEFHMTTGYFFVKVFETVKYHDFFSGLLKTFFFAIIITILSCHRGLNTYDGTRGVGQSTTWSVVVCSIAILISDYFLSKLFLVLWIL